MRSLLAGLMMTIFSVMPVSPQSTTRPSVHAGPHGIALDQIKWTKNPDGTGRETATLFGDRGDRSKPGEPFGWVVKWPPHLTTKAHSHPTARYVMVLSGVYYQGYGNKLDATKLERGSIGTLFTEPAGVGHFGVTKEEGAILYFVGIGPDRTDVIEK